MQKSFIVTPSIKGDLINKKIDVELKLIDTNLLSDFDKDRSINKYEKIVIDPDYARNLTINIYENDEEFATYFQNNKIFTATVDLKKSNNDENITFVELKIGNYIFAEFNVDNSHWTINEQYLSIEEGNKLISMYNEMFKALLIDISGM